MTTPTAGELALLRTQPHRSKLYLSIFEPQTVFAARVNDLGAAKGDMVITYDTVTTGNYLGISGGMTMYVGTTLGGKEKGAIWTYKRTSTTITVGENSHINWADGDYLTVVNFHQIWPVYPRYTQSATDITVYKFYDLAYNGQNEKLGGLMVMGGNYAGFINQTTGSCMVYYDGSETSSVNGTTGSAFSWSFEGGTPTGSSAVTPGWINYTGTGHYRTLLSITSPTGTADYGIRQVSIYDRPGEGDNTPILSWGLESLAGSRDEGGYTGRLWVKEDVSSVVDGALVVLFSDNWYGDTKQSIGGNSSNRENIFFVGYIMDGSIDYDYQTSTAFFDVGSPSEIMKLCEAFGVELEDSGDPVASALAKGVDPWIYMAGLTVKSALWEYYAFTSSCQSLMDMRYIGTDFDLSHFSADRTSLYDASNTFLKEAVYGKACCDRQGAMYFEVESAAINNAAATLNTNMFIDSHDWMGNPNITEQMVDAVSYYEAGGTAYYGISAGSGTYTPLLAAGPGLVPAYRGRNMKTTGLALTSQGQLNTLVGNIWANLNADYPDVSLDLVGNFSNIDIAPQEVVKLTLNVADTFRGISWNQKAFTPTSMTWNYDAKDNLLLPSISLAEVTQGNAGQTIAIPLEPPDAGYKQPPIQLPPPMPSFPVPPIDWGFSGYEWVPSIEDPNDPDSGWMAPFSWELTLGANDTAYGWWLSNPGYTASAITIYPYVVIVGSSDGNICYTMTVNWAAENTPGSWTDTINTGLADPWSIYTVSGAPGMYRLPGLLLGPGTTDGTYASGDHSLQLFFTRKGAEAPDTIDDTIYFLGWLIAYG